uniref:Ribonucleoside-diphosphate reductase small chain n=1 Tax=Arundo donax TaxID=35708 RepID=A0A0A9DNY4_ARUDO
MEKRSDDSASSGSSTSHAGTSVGAAGIVAPLSNRWVVWGLEEALGDWEISVWVEWIGRGRRGYL